MEMIQYVITKINMLNSEKCCQSQLNNLCHLCLAINDLDNLKQLKMRAISIKQSEERGSLMRKTVGK